MSDLIDRQAAIDFIDAGHLCDPNEPRWSDNEIVNFLKSRPSAQPEPKKGKWIKEDSIYETVTCSVCHGVRRDNRINHINFCNCCGADMRGEENETD